MPPNVELVFDDTFQAGNSTQSENYKIPLSELVQIAIAAATKIGNTLT